VPGGSELLYIRTPTQTDRRTDRQTQAIQARVQTVVLLDTRACSRGQNTEGGRERRLLGQLGMNGPPVRMITGEPKNNDKLDGPTANTHSSIHLVMRSIHTYELGEGGHHKASTKQAKKRSYDKSAPTTPHAPHAPRPHWFPPLRQPSPRLTGCNDTPRETLCHWLSACRSRPVHAMMLISPDALTNAERDGSGREGTGEGAGGGEGNGAGEWPTVATSVSIVDIDSCSAGRNDDSPSSHWLWLWVLPPLLCVCAWV